MGKKLRYKYIYSLSHPVSGEIRYIGQTYDLTNRLNQHIIEQCGGKYEWIKSIQDFGLLPVITELACVVDYLAAGMENHYIFIHREMGCNLFNKNSIYKQDCANTSFLIRQDLRGLLRVDAANNGLLDYDLLNKIIEKYYIETIGFTTIDKLDNSDKIKTSSWEKK